MLPREITSTKLTDLAQQRVGQVLKPGDLAIDGTAGNGHDSLFLARAVGPNGQVYAFDVQAAAIEATGRLLADQKIANVLLIHESHAEMGRRLPASARGRVRAVMFNLGYLPGGDHRCITQAESTTTALGQVLDWLAPKSILTVLAYPGHEGGSDDAAAVEQFVSALEPSRFRVEVFEGPPGRRASPRLYILTSDEVIRHEA
jgi:predicted methyltransferase